MAGITFSVEESTVTSTCICQEPPPFEPCLLLQDGDQQEEDRCEQLLLIDDFLVESCEISGASPKTVFAVAWSLLLRYFVGQSAVSFGFILLDQLKSHGCILASVIRGEVTVQDLLSTFEKSIASIDCECSSTLATKEKSMAFDTSMIFHDLPDSGAGVLTKPHSILELQVCKSKDHCFRCLVSYDASKISKPRANEITETLKSILHSMFACLHLPVNQVDLFSESQRRVFENRLQNTPDPSEKLLHELMESHALTAPESLAVVGWDRNFTYRQLKEHSSRLSYHLRSLGVGPGAIVPILSVKSAWVPVVIVGILKSGAAILTMDPSHPTERLDSIISRVNAKVVIASDCPSQVEDVVFPTIETLVRISDIPDLPDIPTDAEAFEMWDNTHPAYIIFTSGSTGVPKGVVIDHSAVVTSSLGFGRALKISPATRIIQFAAHSFDICILELCTTLLLGGTVCIPSEEERLEDIAGAMEKMKVNSAFFTPTVARLIHPDNVPSLKNLFLGGEPLQTDNVTRWAERVNLFNGWGPAETTILCTVQEMTIDSDPKHVGPPLGCSAWIVNYDDDNVLSPDGSPGEVVIMGPVCGLEYLNDPEKTSKSFIEQPHWFHDDTFCNAKNQHRLYKTGDSGYLKADGTLMILGRRDNQIKLHGQRIELGEIEFNLRQVLPDQYNVVVDVISPGGDESNKQLAAFIVLPNGENDEKAEVSDKSLLPLLAKIRADLLLRVPKYMCPSVYIPIAEMPETTSNKADRKALRSLGSAKTVHELAAYNGIERSHREPTTTMEKKLQSLWSETLNLKTSEIGTNDSFFMLGGDSIKAIVLVAAARKAGLSVSFNNIFKTPTLSELALTVQDATDMETSSVEPFSIIKVPATDRLAQAQIKSAGISYDAVEDYYPTTAEQDRMFRQTLINPKSHVILFPYKLGPEIDVDQLRQACNHLVEACPIFRTRILSLSDSTSLQVVMKESIQWQDLKGGAKNAKPLCVGFGKPLASWSITNSKAGEDDKFFVFAVHHTLMDGWSINLLWKAVAYAYEHGKAPPVPASFNALIKYYESRDQEATDNFWRNELANAQPSTLLTMPSKSYIPFQTTRLENRIVLPKPTNSNITMSTILQVSFAMTLATYEKSNDIIFRTTGTGRNQPVPDLQEIIGAVLTSFPVRIQFEPTEPLIRLLERVQNHSLEINEYEYRGIEHIKNLADNSKGIVCDSNSPYLIVQAEAFGGALDGMTKLESEWVPSQTPFSVCCILKPDGVKIATGFDSRMIGESMVKEDILPKFEAVVGAVLRQLNSGKGDLTLEMLMLEVELESKCRMNA